MTDAMLPGLFQRLPICVIGYVRVSDKSQLRGASLETQATALRKYCTERGWVLLDIVEEVYRGYYLAKRQKLSDSVRAFVRAKKIHAVVVNSLDRLSRNPIHQAVLLHEMEEHGVRLESVTEHLEASAVGSFLSQTIGFAAIEREKILERSTRGIQSRVDKGQMLGGGMPLYGYNWGDEKHTHYVIVPGEAAIVYEVI